MAPSLCGSFLTDKRSLVAFTWTLTTVLTLVAFVGSAAMMIHQHIQYKQMERYYEEQYNAQQEQQQQQDDGEEEHGGSQDQNREYEQYLALAALQSGTMTFVALYTVFVALGLSLYGTTAIVGFTSLRGDYIAPCFSSGSSNLQLGIFGGAIVFFANLLLVCAVIFGEVRIEDGRDERKEGEEEEDRRDDREPYEIERIATVLAVTCMFLAALYSIFAVLLFLFFGNRDSPLLDEEEDVSPKQPTLPAIANDPRRENFITMGIDN